MKPARLPTLFISHGGGPWPYVDGMRQQFAITARELGQLPPRPKAVLVITGHWQAPEFTVSTAEHPPTEYDYYGFPEHTYHIQYPAAGSPALAARIRQLLTQAGMDSAEDASRGFDHGTFVPLDLMFPQADVPVVLLSLKADYDADAHIRAGQALLPLRDEGVLIVGSGLTYHNMRGFGRQESLAVSEQFERYLNDAVTDPDPARRLEKLRQWQMAPAARLAHPQEDHLIPLLVVAGAAGADSGRRIFMDKAMNVVMASYRFD
ncbi:MAG TPA: class III extradiol ring-cleavage dioxygenase [Methylophilaceae bacterium]|nr:class III extradiol ring-cleavage dioxygenase [Methylophilaceae bacterium]